LKRRGDSNQYSYSRDYEGSMYQLVFHLVLKKVFGFVETDFTLLTTKSKDCQLIPLATDRTSVMASDRRTQRIAIW
jgi:hypothetical protein